MHKLEKFKTDLRDPKARVETIELTLELKEKLIRVTDEVIDLLQKRCKRPSEAYIVVDFLKQSLEEMFDITGGIVLAKDETGES